MLSWLEFSPYTIFVSHSGCIDSVNRLVCECQKNDIKYFADTEKLSPGDELILNIIANIDCSDELAVISTASGSEVKKSWWMGLEYGVAIKLGKRITILVAASSQPKTSGFMVNNLKQLNIMLKDDTSLNLYGEQLVLRRNKKRRDYQDRLIQTKQVRAPLKAKVVSPCGNPPRVHWAAQMDDWLGQEALICGFNEHNGTVNLHFKGDDSDPDEEKSPKKLCWAAEWISILVDDEQGKKGDTVLA